MASRHALVLLVLLPLAGFSLATAIFWNRLPEELPVAVVDADRSLLSRRLLRMLDATKSIRVAGPYGTSGEALDEVLAGRAYGVAVTGPTSIDGVRQVTGSTTIFPSSAASARSPWTAGT